MLYILNQIVLNNFILLFILASYRHKRVLDVAYGSKTVHFYFVCTKRVGYDPSSVPEVGNEVLHLLWVNHEKTEAGAIYHVD